MADALDCFWLLRRPQPAQALDLVVDNRIVLRSGNEEIRLCRLIDAPYIGKAKSPKKIANMLAGVAAGWALDLSRDVLITGIKTFGLALPDPVAHLAGGMTRIPKVQQLVRDHNRELAAIQHELWRLPGFNRVRQQVGKATALARNEWARTRRSSEKWPGWPSFLKYVRKQAAKDCGRVLISTL